MHVFGEISNSGVLNGQLELGKFGSLFILLPTSCRFHLVLLLFVFLLLLLT
jgi:hypothetical protein